MISSGALRLIQIPVLEDNFIYLIHDSSRNKTLALDPAEAGPLQRCLDEQGWTLDLILNTHHHSDHTGGNKDLQKRYACPVYASAYDVKRTPGITKTLQENDRFELGSMKFEVLETPGHTLGHIAYWMPQTQWLFCGDTLFSLGCGRLFEGKPALMWESLKKLRQLPDETLVFCTHEYTLANALFAESLPWSTDESKAFIQSRRLLRARGEFTVPSRLADEKICNPFLQADNPSMQKALGMEAADPSLVFAEIRSLKDRF